MTNSGAIALSAMCTPGFADMIPGARVSLSTKCGSGVNVWCRIDESMFDVENPFLRYTYGLLGCGTIGCKQVGKDHRV